jgi:DNA polymerase V
MGLFEAHGDKSKRVGEVKREINARHGCCAVRSAATLPLAGVYGDPANGHDICDVRGKVCF